MNSTLEKLSPWLFTIGLFVLWEAACRIFKIDRFILPAPSRGVRGDGAVLAAAAAPFVRDVVDDHGGLRAGGRPSASCSG